MPNNTHKWKGNHSTPWRHCWLWITMRPFNHTSLWLEGKVVICDHEFYINLLCTARMNLAANWEKDTTSKFNGCLEKIWQTAEMTKLTNYIRVREGSQTDNLFVISLWTIEHCLFNTEMRSCKIMFTHVFFLLCDKRFGDLSSPFLFPMVLIIFSLVCLYVFCDTYSTFSGGKNHFCHPGELTWKESIVSWMKVFIFLERPSTCSSVMKVKTKSWIPSNGINTRVDLANLGGKKNENCNHCMLSWNSLLYPNGVIITSSLSLEEEGLSIPRYMSIFTVACLHMDKFVHMSAQIPGSQHWEVSGIARDWSIWRTEAIASAFYILPPKWLPGWFRASTV